MFVLQDGPLSVVEEVEKFFNFKSRKLTASKLVSSIIECVAHHFLQVPPIKFLTGKFLWAVLTSITEYIHILDKAITDLKDPNNESFATIPEEPWIDLVKRKTVAVVISYSFKFYFSFTLSLHSCNSRFTKILEYPYPYSWFHFQFVEVFE